MAGKPPPTPTNPHQIGPDEVRAGIHRELHVLAEDGHNGPDALRAAIAITAAKIRNSSILVERQRYPDRCHTCGGLLDDARPVVAVLQATGGKHLWLHGGECHDAHSRRRIALVDAIVRAAGYGHDHRTGEAA